MSLYSMAGTAAMSYNPSPVPPVNRVRGVNGTLSTKTVEAPGVKGAKEAEALGAGEFAISNTTAAPMEPARDMYVDPLTNQRVWSA